MEESSVLWCRVFEDSVVRGAGEELIDVGMNRGQREEQEEEQEEEQ